MPLTLSANMAKSTTIKVTIAADEKDRIAEAAKAVGLSTSAFIRKSAIISAKDGKGNTAK